MPLLRPDPTKNNAFWGTELQRVLVKALVETVAQPQTAIPTTFMHIKPTRIESDEVTVRLRRIEEQLADLSRSFIAARPQIQSGFAEKIQSPLAAQAEAVRLLRSLSPPDVVRQLVLEGYGQAMAEDAVFVAANQMGDGLSNGPRSR